MTFEQAWEEAKKGKSIRLPEWERRDHLRAFLPIENGEDLNKPRLFLAPRIYTFPWTGKPEELYSENWEVVE